MRFSLRASTRSIALGCALILSPALIWGRHHDTARDLTPRIQREHNPVKKAKLEVRMGRVLLDEAMEAYDHNQIPKGKELLASYTTEMQGAWKLLQSTGRNAAKKPDGFMQLEIALRENRRELKQLRRRVYYLYRGPIDQTLKTVNQVHSHVLVELFPGAVPPPEPSPAKNHSYQASKAGASKDPHP